MNTAYVKYIGDLQTEITHLKSNSVVTSDAPLDNNGKGSTFSPTDMTAVSLASCMITVIAIHCDKNNIPFTKAEAHVTKKMASNPRRIDEIHIELDLQSNEFPENYEDTIKRIAKTCPVANSLHPGIKQVVVFKF